MTMIKNQHLIKNFIKCMFSYKLRQNQLKIDKGNIFFYLYKCSLYASKQVIDIMLFKW